MSQISWEGIGGSGLSIGLQHDTANETVSILHHQSGADIDKIIRDNHLMRTTVDQSAARRAGLLYQIANIPNGLLMEWLVKYGADINCRAHWPRILQLIASNEYNRAVATVDGTFMKDPVRSTFIGARDRASHPLASNLAQRGPGGLIKAGVF